MQAAHASQIAERAKTLTGAPSRGAKCNFPSAPEVLRLHRHLASGPPLGHPNSLKIALARAVCAKVRARAPLNAKKRTFGGPRVPKGAPMDPKWEQMAAQNDQKSQFCEKVPTVVWTIIYSIFSLSALSQTLLFHTSKPLKCTPVPRGASDAAPGLQNGAPGAEKL